MKLALLRGRMVFYRTGTGQALGLDRIQSLPNLPCVLGAASIHYTGQGLKKWYTLLVYLGPHQAVASFIVCLLSTQYSMHIRTSSFFLHTKTAGDIQGLELSSIIPSCNIRSLNLLLYFNSIIGWDSTWWYFDRCPSCGNEVFC